MIPVYRADPYLQMLETAAVSVAEESSDDFGPTQLIICREALFAEGGGQPRDYGKVTAIGETRDVLELVKHKGDIRVRIKPIEGLKKGMPVTCEIDFDRRLRIMKLHTAQHALAACVREQLGSYVTGGMQIDEAARMCSMRFSSEQIVSPRDTGPHSSASPATVCKTVATVCETVATPVVASKRQNATAGDQLAPARERFAEIVREARTVRTEQLESIVDAPRLYPDIFRESDPSVSIRGKVRMVIIDGLDANACGGTHVRSTGELGRLDTFHLASGAEPQEYLLSFSLSS
ncbi:MAG: hypothetical protein U0136_07700 [Bdellovibrionota bacterium]